MDMWIQKLEEQALVLGAYKCGSIAVVDVPFDASLRKNCKMNYCGSYGKNWM